MDSFNDNEKRALMRSILTLILSEISQEDNNNEKNISPSFLTSKCIDLIELNLCKEITLFELSKSLNVSVSSLTKSFKRDMGTSVCRYILRKRLILAHQKISSGTPATLAAIECGFNDYSGFYKQYKKMFNAAPSQKGEKFQ